jgi:hypothetical protein
MIQYRKQILSLLDKVQESNWKNILKILKQVIHQLKVII